MTTKDTTDGAVTAENLDKLSANLNKVEELTQRLTQVLTHRSTHNPALDGPNQELFAKAANAYWTEALRDPSKVIEHQLQFWTKSVTQFIETQQAIASGQLKTPAHTGRKDRRFANPLWETHPYFNYVKQQYLINSDAISDAVDAVTDMDPKEKQRLAYFSRQIVDMMSPTNFLATNPDALQRAMETQGQSLIDGMHNLIADLEANEGELVVRLADETAFEVGGNIATAKGSVVFRNEMLELIQYALMTDNVHETPIIMYPPWINKYSILDLKEQNSLIRWVVEQGYTLFVVSWVNPDASYANVGMEEYIEDEEESEEEVEWLDEDEVEVEGEDLEDFSEGDYSEHSTSSESGSDAMESSDTDDGEPGARDKTVSDASQRPKRKRARHVELEYEEENIGQTIK